jgi:dienelactone hydrolase
MNKSGWIYLLLAGLLGLSWLTSQASTAGIRPQASPGDPGPCPVANQTVTLAGGQSARIYYPNASSCPNWASAPYPGLAFAHGFGMFGLSDGVADNLGNAEHLASWGYVVALPALPDDAEPRITILRSALDYLQTQTATSGSFLFGKVDVSRLAAVGHSLGGSTALAAAARDSRIKAVVGLDPVYHGGVGGSGDPVWNPEQEAPQIQVPAGILGAPPSSCNADSDYIDIYGYTGSTHKASYLIEGASHCDFADPGNSFCSVVCGSTSPARTVIIQRYMTAWLNYYLHYTAADYTYIFGAQAAQDDANGLVAPQVQTAPRAFSAQGQAGSIRLNWELYSHPILGGYQIFRRLTGDTYPAQPYAQPGMASSYVDAQVTPGVTYYYVINSVDTLSQAHGRAAEVSAAASGGSPPPSPTIHPSVTPQHTPTPTLTPTATQPPPPLGDYNLYLPEVRR